MKRGLLFISLVLMGALPAVAAPDAVHIAESQLGVLCQDVTLPGYNVSGRHTNGCADLVTVVEAQAGAYKLTPGDAWVETFEKAMLSQGWRTVQRSETKPGDVAIFHNANGQDQHTEIVVTDGATRLIGNNGDAQEMVSYDAGNWGNPTFYTPPRRVDRQQLEAQLQQSLTQLAALETESKQVEQNRARVQNLATNADQWYQEGALSKRETQSLQQQAKDLKQRSQSLTTSLAQARAQVADASAQLGTHPSLPTTHPIQPSADAAHWQSLYDQGVISRAELEQHISP